jgi:hypothetical protein
METAVFSCFAVATLAALSSDLLPIAALVGSLAALTRPEGALLVGMLMIGVWWRRHESSRGVLITTLGFPILILGTWAIYALSSFGSLVPQSVAAKAALSQDPTLARFSWINLALFFLRGQYGEELYSRTYLQLTPVLTIMAGIATGGMVADVRTGRRLALERMALLLVVPACYVAVLAFGHAFTFFPWYYGPLYPFFAVLAVIGVARVSRKLGANLVLPTAILVSAQVLAGLYVKLPNDVSYWVEGYRRVAAVVPRRQDVSVAAFEIGTVGWVAWPARVIDLAGLVTPQAVGAAPEVYLESVEPDYLVLRTDDADPFLTRVAATDWLGDNYVPVSVVKDPFAEREFRAYAHRRPARPAQPR